MTNGDPAKPLTSHEDYPLGRKATWTKIHRTTYHPLAAATNRSTTG